MDAPPTSSLPVARSRFETSEQNDSQTAEENVKARASSISSSSTHSNASPNVLKGSSTELLEEAIEDQAKNVVHIGKRTQEPRAILGPSNINNEATDDTDEGKKDADIKVHEQAHGSDTDNTIDNDKEVDDERADWPQILTIPEEKLQRLLLDCLDDTHSLGTDCTRILRRDQGSYNVAVIMSVCKYDRVTEYVIRIPAHGTAATWREEDIYMMDRQVELMKQIRTNSTEVSVPEILEYSSSLDNSLGAPYMIMEKLKGMKAGNIWFDDPCNEDTPWILADCPSDKTHRKRVTFLKSLATVMTRLPLLEFHRIGMPHIPQPYVLHHPYLHTPESPDLVGHSYHWPSTADIHYVIKREPFASTQEYIKEPLDKYFPTAKGVKNGNNRHDNEIDLRAGVRKILDIVFATPTFNPENKPEKFTIYHPDLDLQNILTDEEGNVTGIIDWDGAFAAPRCIGPIAVPMFLQRDWFPDHYGESLYNSPHMAWNAEYYRSIYAAALVRAHEEVYPDIKPEDSDVRFTLKSPIYQAAFASLYEGGNPYDFTDRILREIPDFRTDPFMFKLWLGSGWPAAEQMLRREIPRVLVPVLPTEAAFRELEVNFTNEDEVAENASAPLEE